MNTLKTLVSVVVLGSFILNCMADGDCDGTNPANCVVFLRQQYPPTCNYSYNGHTVCINIYDGDVNIYYCNPGTGGICEQNGTVTCNYSWSITDASTGDVLDSGPGQINPPTFTCQPLY